MVGQSIRAMMAGSSCGEVIGVRTGRAVLLPLVMVVALVLTACSSAPPPAPVSTTPTTPVASTSQIVIGVDGIVGGYNSHNLADQSTITTALSQLLLPSVFRSGQDGSPQLDKNLMRSAEVISDQPFKVAYEIRQDASWSDGAPIAVEDFIYLADAMRTEPGTVQPAGYRLISGIQPGEGGKRVEVTFDKPYPGWENLFSNLLPAHLLKDAPGGWKGALTGGFPVYGGPFSIKNLDRDRGEIILERNERYWEKPAAMDRLVFRSSDQPGLVNALRSGTDQFVMARTDAAGVKMLTDLGNGVKLQTVASPRIAEVLLRPSSPTLSNGDVRTAIAALIDRNKLIDIGTNGGPSASLRADAQVLPPSDPKYKATLPGSGSPAALDPAKAQQLLTSAGYTKDAGTWRKDGKSLSLVIASPGQQEPYATIAKTLADQLTSAGVEVRIINPQPRDLFSGLLAMPVTPPPTSTSTSSTAPAPGGSGIGVDIAVVPQSVGGDPATILASDFGCPTIAANADSAAPVVPANSAAFCDKDAQSKITAALTGSSGISDVLSSLEPRLWQEHVTIPLFQLADTLVISTGVGNLDAGPPLMGPFSSAVNWTRVVR